MQIEQTLQATSLTQQTTLHACSYSRDNIRDNRQHHFWFWRGIHTISHVHWSQLLLNSELCAQASTYALFPLANHKSCSPDFFFVVVVVIATGLLTKPGHTWNFSWIQAIKRGCMPHSSFQHANAVAPKTCFLTKTNKKKTSFLIAWHFSSTTKAQKYQKRTFVSFPNCT